MAQAIKTLEEVTELISALHRNNREEALDAYGDVLVTLIIGADLAGFDLVDALAKAYHEIKDRKGTLRGDGVFVKEAA
jgi:NTP pyrophosphatase (non-canonical NTP hydrolase)